MQAAVGELFDDLLLDGSAVDDEVLPRFGRCMAVGRVRRQFPDRIDRDAMGFQADDIIRHLPLQNTR